jgi:hypothetical protein
MNEQELTYLTEFVGIEEDEARRMLVDSDLWILEPSMRFAIEEEEAVRVWKEAADKLGGLAFLCIDGDIFGNNAITQCIADAEARAREALRRARERARGASR